MKQNQQPRPHRVRRAGLFLLALTMTMPGCASVANWAAMRSIPVAGPTNPVVDFACIWQQGEGRDEHGRPCRGFCGQLMFLTGVSKKPGVVNGAVTIYVFDNVGTLEEQTKPFKTFDFTAEQWASFQRRTNLGMTYQLFVPYTRPGGREAECQVHVKFTPVGGSPIYSHPEMISLRGAAGAAAAMADSIDRKLNSSSKLFQNPAMMTGSSVDPAYVELMQKMRTDAATPTVPRSLPSAARTTQQKQPDMSRLQAVLESSTSTQVQQAEYAEDPAQKRRVTQALHEELQ